MTVFESVFSKIPAFVYRCQNDLDYTMVEMSSGVSALLGYDPEDLIENRTESFVGLTHEEDKERVFDMVDAAIERNDTWDVLYRVKHLDGSYIWIRDRGVAVKENHQIYLQGLIVSAADERIAHDELENMVADTKAANQEIITLTQNITTSIRALKMLSINARIEAARSGEAGLGFTVVANEMKKLADQNAEWARIISQKIKQNERA